jgi:hypothetical protein
MNRPIFLFLLLFLFLNPFDFVLVPVLALVPLWVTV